MTHHTYIWINPVTAGLYSPEALASLLFRRGCTRVHCTGDWGQAVRDKTLRCAARSRQTPLADARCPMAADLVRRHGGPALAPVEPILIHAARELAGREDLADGPKLITTPCAALAELGNSLHLPRTRFVPWTTLLKEWGEPPVPVRLKESPIPPGFFDNTGLRVKKITGEAQITAYLAAERRGDEQLVELLYCPEGCHNGDGVLCDA